MENQLATIFKKSPIIKTFAIIQIVVLLGFTMFIYRIAGNLRFLSDFSFIIVPFLISPIIVLFSKNQKIYKIFANIMVIGIIIFLLILVVGYHNWSLIN